MRTNQHSGWQWHEIQKQVLAENRRDNGGRCQSGEYGCLGDATEVHHPVERVNGGSDDDELLALCSVCHSRITTQANQQRARQRKKERDEARRKDHPGRRDRYIL